MTTAIRVGTGPRQTGTAAMSSGTSVARKISEMVSCVFDTECISNQKMMQINAFELSFNLQCQPTLYLALLSCNLQKFLADF